VPPSRLAEGQSSACAPRVLASRANSWHWRYVSISPVKNCQSLSLVADHIRHRLNCSEIPYNKSVE
jgi:hypothetical protein